jgi:hypothetical protein
MLQNVPVDGELFVNAPGRWLAIQIHQFIYNMIWLKQEIVPLEIINDDPNSGIAYFACV